MSVHVCACEHVYVCVCEREREREPVIASNGVCEHPPIQYV